MSDFLIAYKDQILIILAQYFFIIGNPFVVIGFVWTIGRLLGIVKTDRVKNWVAYITIVILHILYQYLFGKINAFEIFCFSCLSVIFYVGFLWRLYYRLDSWQDKKIGDDHKFKPTKKKNNKSAK